MLRRFLRFLLRFFYRYQAFNEAVLNTPGPVLLLPNHVSWWDWLLIGVCLDEDWKFLVSTAGAEVSWLHRKITINRRSFVVDMNSPFAVKHMADFLHRGGRLVLFPEGRLSRTGSLMKLFDGTGFLILKTGAKVITAYNRHAERLPFSPNPGFKQWFPKLTVHFSSLLTPPKIEHSSVTHARSHLTDWLHAQMVRHQFETEMQFGPKTLPEAIDETARRRPSHTVLQDASMKALDYKRLSLASDLFARELSAVLPLSPQASAREGEHQDEKNGTRVGVLLPNVNGLPIVVLSLWQIGRTPAVLNFSTGPAILLACARLADLKQIVTSRAFLENIKLDPALLTSKGIELIYLEDIRGRISRGKKFGAFLRSLGSFSFARHHWKTEDTAVVLFTSGSEGNPKGVELTHRNLLANIRQMLSVVDLLETDRFFNALPLFHSFGLVIGVFLPLARGIFSFLYLSPLHYRVVPSAFYNLDCTILFGTNTFLSGYARKAHPYDFHNLRYLIAGAEKLQESTAQIWMQKFGVGIIEGYGATECGPCLSVNTPLHPRTGSTGQLLPGIEYRLEPVEGISNNSNSSNGAPDGAPNSAIDGAEQGGRGRLFVRGPNIMKGYLNPDANANFKALGGWYDTGDIVRIDADGFVFILGRLKRFAKVSGEMVSLTAVEEALAGAFPVYGLKFSAAVVARPDEGKGERLIAVTNEPKLTLEQVRAAIRGRGLSNLAVPRELKILPELPRLGTGKINYRELEKMV
jgi:acyl-[acyl-carrier-protein]-phospholipid O-acyltransferase / long-chain-fatty-acid--[acyl-carrier-protein] ligase